MNLQNLSKEQKQLAMLAVMGLVVVIALGNQLVLGPAKTNAAKAATLLDEKGGDMDSGQRLLQRDPQIRKTLQEDAAILLSARASGEIPPRDGKEFWAQKRVRTIGYTLGLDLAVSLHNPGQPRHIVLKGSPGKTAKEAADLPFWIPYPVEVRARLSYAQLNALLTELQRREPYASVGVLRVIPSMDDPVHHSVTLVVQWPVPRDEEEWTSLSRLQAGAT